MIKLLHLLIIVIIQDFGIVAIGCLISLWFVTHGVRLAILNARISQLDLVSILKFLLNWIPKLPLSIVALFRNIEEIDIGGYRAGGSKSTLLIEFLCQKMLLKWTLVS